MLLLASIAILATAPLLYGIVNRHPAWLAGLDGFIFASILGLVVLVILPETVAVSGWAAAAAAAAGFIGPALLERALSQAAAKTHAFTLLIAIVGLALHAFTDGIALGQPAGQQTGQMLAIAVILHRVPVGLTVWWLLRPRRGLGAASLALLSIAIATLLGYAFGDAEFISSRMMVVQALVAGSLLHVIVHRHHIVESPRVGTWQLYDGIGALVGLLTVAALIKFHAHVPLDHVHAAAAHGAEAAHAARHGGPTVLSVFISLAAESAPALLLAYLGAGLIHAFLPQASVRWMSRGGPLSRSLRGVLFGLPLPVCSCGVIPLYRGLVLRGVPAAAAMAFLVATPEIGIDAALLSVPLLGGWLTLARVTAAALVALLVGWLVGRTVADPLPAAAAIGDAGPGGFAARVRAGLQVGFGELVDSTAPWILFGLAVAAVASPALEGAWIVGLPRGLDVPLLALAGMPTYVCASGATPLVATLVAKGISPGAALALLLTGPATNATTFGVLSDLHGSRTALAFGASVAAAAIGLGYATNLLLPSAQVFVPPREVHLSLLSTIALSALALLALASLLRQGPRGFIGQVLQAGHKDEHAGDGCCDGGCGDDHDGGHEHVGDCGCSHERDGGRGHERDGGCGHEHDGGCGCGHGHDHDHDHDDKEP